MIHLKGVGKAFWLQDEGNSLFGALRRLFAGENRAHPLVALKGITFDVHKGEFIGIIGPNGAGKTTLLKVLAGILPQTTGTFAVEGKVTPLLELGLGFQPDLAAKEDVYLYGSLLGLTRKELEARYGAIVRFAELERFMHVPLRNFSSGMQVRLAFAVAIQTRPDILLIDEILAVGDAKFQEKCFTVVEDLKKNGTTILLVSHDLGAITRYSDKVLVLLEGTQFFWGDTDQAVRAYLDQQNVQHVVDARDVALERSKVEAQRLQREIDARDVALKQREGEIQQLKMVANTKKKRWGTKEIEVTAVQLFKKKKETAEFSAQDPLKVRIHYTAHRAVKDPIFGVMIRAENGAFCYGTNTLLKGVRFKELKGRGMISLDVAELPLAAGTYLLTVNVHSRKDHHYDWLDNCYAFHVRSRGKDGGLVRMKARWSR